MLMDRFGRRARDLRISVTDRCNYKCAYCMPAHVEWLPKPEILNFDEIARLAGIFVCEGIEKIRITGGEPLARRDLVILASRLAAIEGVHDISLTTNGYFLAELAAPLRDAGVQRINVSLDTLRPDRFRNVTGSDSFERVLQGIRAARSAGFEPIKVNCVVVRGFNDDEIVDFLRWGMGEGLEIRFIEFMPLDGDHHWALKNVMSQAEILQRIGEFFPVEKVECKEPRPAVRFGVSGSSAEFGVIASVTEPFCTNCSRVRLTADGKFRTCLFAMEETDLKGPVRSGMSRENIAAIVREAAFRKWAGHRIHEKDFRPPDRAMYAIGG
jgi:cyclic pyranopterin phosphate synthase